MSGQVIQLRPLPDAVPSPEVPGLPAALSQMPPRPLRALVGTPGRQPTALVIAASLATPGTLALCVSLRWLGFQVAVCPADGAVDRDPDHAVSTGYAEAGIVCLGRPGTRSVEELLSRNPGAFAAILLLGAGMARGYEALARMHDPAARVLFSATPACADRAARDAVLAAYACDATLVGSVAEAAWFGTALPESAVHVMHDTGQVQNEALRRALGTACRRRAGVMPG